MPMAGDFRLAYEQREVGQSQESVTWQPGQRARDVFESSCKQTQFSSHTHHNHTYLQSARMWQIDRYAERLNFNRRKREKKHSRCCTRVVKKKSLTRHFFHISKVCRAFHVSVVLYTVHVCRSHAIVCQSCRTSRLLVLALVDMHLGSAIFFDKIHWVFFFFVYIRRLE